MRAFLSSLPSPSLSFFPLSSPLHSPFSSLPLLSKTKRFLKKREKREKRRKRKRRERTGGSPLPRENSASNCTTRSDYNLLYYDWWQGTVKTITAGVGILVAYTGGSDNDDEWIGTNSHKLSISSKFNFYFDYY